MKHTVSKQQLLLYVSGESGEKEHTRIEKHLKRCASCRKEVKELAALHAFIRQHTSDPQESTILSWRRDVLRVLRKQEPKRSFAEAVREFFGFAEGQVLRPALHLVAVACLAFVIGFSMSGDGMQNESNLFAPIAYDPFSSPSADLHNPGDAQVVSVDILSKDEETGDVEFEFEATFRSRVEGNLSDPAIQSILARALISSQNPGVRLRAANTFSKNVSDSKLSPKTREMIKASLVSAVKYDENQGVRLEALNALQDFMPDTLATSAIVYVLRHDKNAAMKIAAINALDLNTYTNTRERDKLSEILRDRSLNDDNNYIRIKAKAALQEVYQ